MPAFNFDCHFIFKMHFLILKMAEAIKFIYSTQYEKQSRFSIGALANAAIINFSNWNDSWHTSS